MTARPPRVSVGLPVYNGEKYLANALTSLQAQEFEDFELIICDNASTDDTQTICREFAAKDDRIRYFRNSSNIGLAANHNRTFELARGELFKWVAHDDDFPRAMLARFVETLDHASPSTCLVYSYCEYIDEFGVPQGVDSDGVALDDPRPHRRLAHLLRNIHMYNSPFGLIRSSALRRTRRHGLYPMADHVLLAELAIVGVLVEIPEPLLRIRRHPGRTFTANSTTVALRELFTPGAGRWTLPIGIKPYRNMQLVVSGIMVPEQMMDRMLCTGVSLATPQWREFKASVGRQRRRLFARPQEHAIGR